jgi:hypothetical protein
MGVYRDDKVELSRRPEGLGESATVLVTFLPTNGTVEAQREPGAADARAKAVARRAAGERFLARLKTGIPFGGPPSPRREELYDRFEHRDENPR